MALPQVQFYVPPQRRRSLIAEAFQSILSAGLGSLASEAIKLPFEKAAEKRQESSVKDAESRQLDNAITLLEDQLSTKARHAVPDAVASGEIVEVKPEEAVDLQGRGFSPSKVLTGEDGSKRYFFEPATLTGAITENKPVEPLTERMLDFIVKKTDSNADVSGKVTRGQAAELSSVLGPALSAAGLDVERARLGTEQERLKQSGLSISASVLPILTVQDYAEFGRYTYNGKPLTSEDIVALKAHTRGSLVLDQVESPTLRHIVERGKELSDAFAEGRMGHVVLDDESINERVNQLLNLDTQGLESIRLAAAPLDQLNLLWHVKKGKLHRVSSGNEGEVADLLRANSDLAKAWVMFQSVGDMDAVIAAQRAGAISPSPQALGYLQLMFKETGKKNWRHPDASYFGLPIPPDFLRENGIMPPAYSSPTSSIESQPSTAATILGQLASPARALQGLGTSAIATEMADNRLRRKQAASGGALSSGDSGAAPSGATASGEVGPSSAIDSFSLEQSSKAYVDMYSSVLDGLTAAQNPEETYKKIVQWAMEKHASADDALSFYLEMGVDPGMTWMQKLKNGTDREKRLILANLRVAALQPIQNARSVWLEKHKP